MQTKLWMGWAIATVGLAWATESAPQFSNAEREAFLKSGSVLSSKVLSMGVTGSKKLMLQEGEVRHSAHLQTIDEFKTVFQTNRVTEFNFRDTYKFNIAAYELAKMIGMDYMVPPSVERKVGGSWGAITWWVDNATMTEKDRLNKKLQPADPADWERQMNLMRVFDQLISNTDRNLGNIVLTEDWQIRLIDHTRAFRTAKTCQNLRVLRAVDAQLLQGLRGLDGAEVRKHLGHYLRSLEIDALLARRDELVRYLETRSAAIVQTAGVSQER